jgi:hypothetical protein
MAGGNNAGLDSTDFVLRIDPRFCRPFDLEFDDGHDYAR